MNGPDEAPQDGPLAGTRVVDLTHVVAGPVCTQLLADAGALVIKVEPPGGEYSRVRGPQRRGVNGRMLTSYNAAVNRGKRNLVLDLKNPAALDVLERLVGSADVMVDNFAPGALERLGISYRELRRRHPRLITASISLWGVDASDDLARRGGVNVVAEAEAGLYEHHREADGSPASLSFALADTGGGLAAYAAIVTALLERDRTGAGQHVNLSMVRNMLSFNAINLVRAQRHVAFDAHDDRFSYLRARDGWVAIDLSDHDHGEELRASLGQWVSDHTSDEVVELAGARGLAVVAVATARGVLADDRYRELGYLWDLPDGVGGTITVPANPLGLDYGNGRIPLDLDDADDLLRTALGIDASELEDLRAAGAFGPTGERRSA